MLYPQEHQPANMYNEIVIGISVDDRNRMESDSVRLACTQVICVCQIGQLPGISGLLVVLFYKEGVGLRFPHRRICTGATTEQDLDLRSLRRKIWTCGLYGQDFVIRTRNDFLTFPLSRS